MALTPLEIKRAAPTKNRGPFGPRPVKTASKALARDLPHGREQPS